MPWIGPDSTSPRERGAALRVAALRGAAFFVLTFFLLGFFAVAFFRLTFFEDDLARAAFFLLAFFFGPDDVPSACAAARVLHEADPTAPIGRIETTVGLLVVLYRLDRNQVII